MSTMVYKWDVTLPKLTGAKKRRAYLYLPDSYEDEPDRRYPVLFMFDGHNVFFDYDATYGKSWGMNSYLTRTRTPLIVAAVECNHEGNGRLCEYSPFSHMDSTLGAIEGRGKLYMDWLTGYFKPLIDSRARTMPDRGHTLIAGSSMGGLMSLYAVTQYNHVFQSAACLSPSLWVDPAKVMTMLKTATIAEDTTIYMDYGSKEIFNHEKSANALISVSNHLLRRHVNLSFRIVPGGSHCEASWEKQIPIFMNCLGY